MMNRSQLTTIAGKMSIALALFIGVSAFAQVPRSKHVYIVAEENRSYEHIVGSSGSAAQEQRGSPRRHAEESQDEE